MLPSDFQNSAFEKHWQEIIKGVADFTLFDLFSRLRQHHVLLNPEKKPTGKLTKLEMINYYYQHFSKAFKNHYAEQQNHQEIN